MSGCGDSFSETGESLAKAKGREEGRFDEALCFDEAL